MDSAQLFGLNAVTNPGTGPRRRITLLGLEKGDMVVIKTILRASARLSSEFDIGAMGTTRPIDVLLVNGESASALDTARALAAQQKNMRIVIVGGNERRDLPHQQIRRPITPRSLEAILVSNAPGSSSTSTPQERATIASDPSSKKLRVLIVDDSLPAREFIRIKIEELANHKAGIDIEMAESGEKALEKTRSRTYDLVFMDVEMSGMDGFTTCRKLKEGHAGTRVVMLTSKSLSQDYTRGREAGCNHYLTKPPVDNDVKTILTLASLTKTTAQER